MKYPNKDKRKKIHYIPKEEVDEDIIPDYFIPRNSSLFISGKR